MIDELLSLRAIVVSGAPEDHDLFRQAASASSVPIEVVHADGAASARVALADGAELAFLDTALASDATAQILSAVRGMRNRPFTIQLAAPDSAAKAFETDALATKPARVEEATQLIEKSIRVRLPSRVLLVDDSSTMRSIVRKLLAATRFPFEVTEAGEGFAALKLVREVEFDIAFLDYNMPGFSGLETMAEFRRERRRLSVVMMTSLQDEGLAERARAQGAAFLKKPFFPADIEAVLCRFYGLRALNPKRP